MASLFSKIIAGEIPGKFVWKDDRAVAFMTIAPLQPGHTLVVPRKEVDHWLDLEPDLASHLFLVSQTIGQAIQHGFQPVKVGLWIAGLEVPHVHLHVFPVHGMSDFNFANQDRNAKPDDIERAAATIRASLRALGAKHVSE